MVLHKEKYKLKVRRQRKKPNYHYLALFVYHLMEAEEKSVHACRLAISLAYPSGKERGVFYLFKLFLPVFSRLIKGGWVSIL